MKSRFSLYPALALSTLVVSSLVFTGCLKTRAQLRDDDGTGPVPNRTEPVAPQASYAVDELKNEMTRMQGRIEDLERANKGNDKAKTDEQAKALDNRIRELEQAQMATIEAIKKIQSDMPAPDNVGLVQKGKDELKNKRYDEAVANFSAYLKNPNGRLAEDAIFYRAEAYFSEKSYKKAIVDFSKFPEKYTKSAYVPKALLRIAQSFEALGAREDAMAFYEQLMSEHPKSSEAKEARKKVSKKKVK